MKNKRDIRELIEAGLTVCDSCHETFPRGGLDTYVRLYRFDDGYERKYTRGPEGEVLHKCSDRVT